MCSNEKSWEPIVQGGPDGAGAGGRELVRMLYFFRRGAESIKCEVRLDSEGQAYELIVNRPNATISVERFVAPPDLNRRWRDIERTLAREGWQGPQVRDS